MRRSTVEQTLKEVQVIKALRHSCVLRFFCCGVDSKFIHISMELMENWKVHDPLNNEELGIPRVVRLRIHKDAARWMCYLPAVGRQSSTAT